MVFGLIAGRDRLEAHFRVLYGEKAPDCLRRLLATLGRYGVGEETAGAGALWDQKDAILISYPDMVRCPGEPPLETLRRFVRERLGDCVSVVHVLPFFPSSSDEGFSVVDYRQVDPAWGSWEDIRGIAAETGLMADLVLNHVSRSSSWAQDYASGILPASRYFIEVDPTADLSRVVRPRSLPLTTSMVRHGQKHDLWTTFSEDQLDLDFSNPDVLFEFIDILLFYVSMGARIIRLDAIAYLWKRLGTTCIHLPETHEVVKLLRSIVSLVAPEVILLTETNVPHQENVSYFGQGDEAHMVYQFTMPPLLLYSLLKGSAAKLSRWAAGQNEPPRGCTYLNFTASHDGIGVRPLEGVVEDQEIEWLADEVGSGGGHVSTRRTPDGRDLPYELNASYFDALGGNVDRFVCSQAVMLALRGIPAVYFHSLTATRNDHEGVETRGYPRAINRRRWSLAELEGRLGAPEGEGAQVFERMRSLLQIRRSHAALHPDAAQEVVDAGEELFCLRRTSPDCQETLWCMHSFAGRPLEVRSPVEVPARDLVSGKMVGGKSGRVRLKPYQVLWLTAGA